MIQRWTVSGVGTLPGVARALVHIGMMKTGSTYFQELLLANIANLNKAGVGYPDFCARRNQHELAIAAMGNIRSLHRRYGVRTPEQHAELRAKVDAGLARMAAGQPAGVLSCEHLSLMMLPEDLERFRDQLNRHFDQIDVVVFLRRQDYLVPSFYSQSIRGAHTAPLDADYVRNQARNFDLAAIVERWQQVFGSERVTAEPYLERTKSDELAVSATLLARLGVSREQIASSWQRPARLVNPSLSSAGSEIVRAINPHLPRSEHHSGITPRKQLVSYISEQFPGNPIRLPVDALTAVQESVFPGNERLRALVPASPLWQEWFDQPLAPTGEIEQPSTADVVRAMIELTYPKGPIQWGAPPPGPPAPPTTAGKVRKLASRVARRIR